MSNTMTSANRLNLEPPRPGSWFLDPTHFSRPVTAFHAEIFPVEFKRGFSESLRRYGSLLEYLDWVFIEGFPYYCARPVGAPIDAVGHPPRHVWDEIARLHPEVQERLGRSVVVFERKLWREDLERFDSETKPATVQEHLALLAVDPGALSTDALLAYLDRCRENQKRGCYLHHFYNVPALLPVGDFLVQAQEWTGRSAADLLGLLQGATPDPLASADELAQLGRALRRDAEAAAMLRSRNDPAEVLSLLRARPGETGTAVAAYVDRVGFRPVNGEDVGDANAIELPELIVEAIRGSLEPEPQSAATDRLVEKTTEVRNAVPARHRAQFDELLGEARTMYRLRDDRGIFCDLWAIGIMRRAILSAGERLMREGRIEHAAHLVEANYEELRAIVAGGKGPSADELARRALFRSQASYRDVPPVLGPEPGPPLPSEWLPPAAARLERALGAAVQALFVAPAPRTEGKRVRGLGASLGVYEGTARVILGTELFGRLRKGDVLVTNSTTTAFNIVLPLLGAIVTDRGGLLSHAAIVAREFGIPAAVGCTDATAVIPDGAQVRVDGRAGEAVVLA